MTDTVLTAEQAERSCVLDAAIAVLRAWDKDTTTSDLFRVAGWIQDGKDPWDDDEDDGEDVDEGVDEDDEDDFTGASGEGSRFA